ncbi:MAG: DNA helicase RecQ, partial [Oscillatoriales cyanobacterium]
EEVYGVGSNKRDKYGKVFLEAIHTFCKEQGLPIGTASSAAANLPTLANVPSYSQMQTWELYRQNLTVQAIANARGMSPTTIAGHLVELRVIYEYLQERYTFEEIKFVRAWWRQNYVSF